MINLRDKLSECHILLFIKMFRYMVYEYWNFTFHTVRCNMSHEPEKLFTEILMTTHALEKAFSLYDKRRGFGVKKAVILIGNIQKYIRKYGYSEKLNVPIELVYSYLVYQRNDGYENPLLDKVETELNAIIAAYEIKKDVYQMAGYRKVNKTEMLDLTNIDFRRLAMNRHSFRHFSKEPVSEEAIKDALEIAKFSPSACNRQAYRVHVFSGEDKDFILKLQGGANSFYKEADKAILITGDMHRYFTTEMHLAYVDGSLFAMSFIYALTSLGVASIPLTMGRKLKTLKSIMENMKIPDNELPVILIAVGNYPTEASLSLSHRNDAKTFTIFH